MRRRNKAMKKKNNFRVPQGYFEQFHDTMMEQIGNKPSKVHPIFGIHNQWKYAAAIALLFIGGGALYIKDTIDNKQMYAQSEEYSIEFIDEMLDNYPIDDYTFYTYLTSNEL
ncbi:MAG: hypothetical protein IKZ37_09450 [Bacteroidaceae bacterium]|nr:hypothetical protein [Bacteroidaceae bacterium]